MDQLAKDAAEARKAGMSYGQWKATQEPVVIRRPEKPEGVCRHCGRELPKGKKIWCSEECCTEGSRKRRREKRGG